MRIRRVLCRMFGLAMLLGQLAACSRGTVPPVRPPDDGGPRLRVLTYNLNYGLAGDAETLQAVRTADADLALLQETSPEWEAILRGRLRAQYPHMHFRHAGAAGGQAFLSRLPVKSVEFYEPVGEGWFPAGRIVVETAFGPVQALNVHLRPPVSDGGSFVAGYFTTGSVRRAEMADFFARLDPALPTIVAGDFNEEAGDDVLELLEAKGLTDVLARFAPEQPTWRWETSLWNFEKQLDHLTHDARLEALSASIANAGRSDHLPVVAVLRPAATAEAPRTRSPPR